MNAFLSIQITLVESQWQLITLYTISSLQRKMKITAMQSNKHLMSIKNIKITAKVRQKLNLHNVSDVCGNY